MADLKEFEINGVVYSLKDETARSQIQQILNEGLNDDIKQALLDCFQHVAWIDSHGQEYYDALEEALYPPATLTSISAVYTQSGTVYEDTPLNDLKSDLVVTALYSDASTEIVPSADYTLSGTLAVGTSTITVSYMGKTTTFNVTVTDLPYTFYDYITMTLAEGGQYAQNEGILTDIGFTTEDTFETSIYYDGTLNTNCNAFGIRNGQSGTKEFSMFYTPSTGKVGYWYSGTDTTNTFTPLVRSQLNTIKFQPVGVSQTYPNNATINVNGTDYNTGSTATGKTFDSWLGFFKYGISTTQTSTNTGDKYGGMRLGETKIINSSNVVLHDLVPASDGEHVGLYDKVTGNFYYHPTSTRYTVGNWE